MENNFAGPSSKVTVVMPCFNSSRTIVDAINSVVSQTFVDWNLTVVDDGSTDNSRLLAESIARHHPSLISVVATDNLGACHARNLAVSRSSSEMLAFLDADDYWHPEKLRLQVQHLSADKELIGVTCGYRLTSADTQRLSRPDFFHWTKESIEDWVCVGEKAPALNSTLIVKRTAFLEAGGYDEELISFSDDLDLGWRLSLLGKLSFVPLPLTVLRSHSGQMHRQVENMSSARGKVLKKIAYQNPGLSRKALRNSESYWTIRTFRASSLTQSLRRLSEGTAGDLLAVVRFLTFRLWSRISNLAKRKSDRHASIEFARKNQLASDSFL